MNKLYWRITEGNTVCFTNSPFTVDCEVVMGCQYGPHYWKDKEAKKKQLRLQRTRKIGCCAHIKIRYYTAYKDYELHNVSLMIPRQLWDHKERVLKELRSSITFGKVTGEKWCYVSLPTENAHSGHPTGEMSGFTQRVHPVIIAKISELVASGITGVQEVRKCLRIMFNKLHISTELNLIPSLTDRSFYPMPCDIRNHISKAKKALELSKVDQENLKLKIEEWKSPLLQLTISLDHILKEKRP